MISETSAPNSQISAGTITPQNLSIWNGMKVLSLKEHEPATTITSLFSQTKSPLSQEKATLLRSPKNSTKKDVPNLIIELVQCRIQIPEELRCKAIMITYLDLSNLRLLNPQTLAILSCFRNLRFLRMPINTSKHFERDDNLEKESDLCFQKIIYIITNLYHLTHLDMSKWLSPYMNAGSSNQELFTKMLSKITSRGRLKRLFLSSCTLLTQRGLSHLIECKNLYYLIKKSA